MSNAYVIMARRGDYSDRTEYAVAWSADKATAETAATRMQEESERQRRRAERSSLPYSESWDNGRAAVGDPMWSPGDETNYSVAELPEAAP